MESVAGGFRLLEASFNKDHPIGARFHSEMPNFSKLIFAPEDQHEGDWTSVLIGKNGLGKSTILAAIADVFIGLDPNSARVRKRGPALISKLKYTANGTICCVDITDINRVVASVDGVACSSSAIPLPARVIALTSTPFDKFRVPRSIGGYASFRDDFEEPSEGIFSYLGLRDRSGRASPSAATFRSLESLFTASAGKTARRHRIAKVFEFLGYNPFVDVRYDRLSAVFPEGKGSSDTDLFGPSTQFPLGSAAQRMLERKPELGDELREAVNAFLARTSERSLSLRANFSEHREDNEDVVLFRSLQILRRARLISPRSVMLSRLSDGSAIDLLYASSGELALVTSFLGLASSVDDNSLILIDEPEISLHPEWQSRYLGLLRDTFNAFSGCHFVLATHSPLILSDISESKSSVIRIEAETAALESGNELAGKSADFLLATVFNTPGHDNLYVKQQIIRGLRLAANGQVRTDDFSQVTDFLRDVLPRIEQEGGVAKVIRELLQISLLQLEELSKEASR